MTATFEQRAVEEKAGGWKTTLPSAKGAIFILDAGDTLYAGSNGWIYKLDAADGRLKSSVQLKDLFDRIGHDDVRLALSPDGAHLFIGSHGHAACVTSELAPVWGKELDGAHNVVNLLVAEALYAATNGHVFRLFLDKAKNQVEAQINLGKPNKEVRLVLADDTSTLFAATGGSAVGLSPAGLAVQWRTPLDGTGDGPVSILTRGKDVYAAGKGRLFKLNSGGNLESPVVLLGLGESDMTLQFSGDGKSLLLGTDGYALSVDAASPGKPDWQTNLMAEQGGPVSLLPSGETLYAGNRGHFFRLAMATGVETFSEALDGKGEGEVGMALSADGAHLFCACDGVVTRVASATDLAAGWQAIMATTLSSMNATLSSLYKAGAIPQTMGSLTIPSAPQLSGAEAGHVKLQVALKGEIVLAAEEGAPAADGPTQLDGYLVVTVNLASLQARIEEEDSQSFLLAITPVSGAFFGPIDLSHLKGLSPAKRTALAFALPGMLNLALSQLKPFKIQKPLPVWLNGLAVRFMYTPVPGDAGKDFLSILFGPAGDEGSLDLQPAIFGAGPGADMAFILGNRLIMEAIHAGINGVEDAGGLEFEVSNSYPARVSNSKRVQFDDPPKGSLKLEAGDVQILVDGKLEIDVTVSFKNLTTAGSWVPMRFKSAMGFSAENGGIRLAFKSELNVSWVFFLNVLAPFFPRLLARLKQFIENLASGEGSVLIAVPGFDVSSITTPAYVQIAGKVQRN